MQVIPSGVTLTSNDQPPAIDLVPPAQLAAQAQPPVPIQPPVTAPAPVGAGPSGQYAGLLEPGNIDLASRPQVKNPDGSVSTVRSASFGIDGKEVLLPTVSPDGRLLTDDEAMDLYRKTGQHLGKFDTPDNATKYAQDLHNSQAKFYGLDGKQPVIGTDPTDSFTPQTPVEAAKGVADDTRKLGADEVKLATEKTQLEQEQAARKQQFDEASAQALEQFQQRQALHREAAQAQVDNLRNQYETKPFTSLWSRLGTGQRVATALSVLAAGISWNSNHTNRALDMLDKAEAEDLDIQKEQHASLLHSIQLAMEGKKDLEANQLHELSGWQGLQAAKWQAIASKMNSLLATNKGGIDVAAVKKAALEAQAKANQGWEGAITAKATANHMDAATALERANTSKVPYEIEKLKAETEKERAIASGAIGPQGGVNIDIKLGNEIDKRLNADKELPKLLSGRDEIAKGLANLGPGANGTQVQGAVDNFIKQATSGKVTAYQAKVFKERAGGLVDRILGDIAKGESGNYGPGQIKTLRDAFIASQQENDRALREARSKHTKALKADPLLARVPGQIDSALSERFGEAGQFVPPPGAVKGKDRKTGATIYQLPTGGFVDANGEPVK